MAKPSVARPHFVKRTLTKSPKAALAIRFIDAPETVILMLRAGSKKHNSTALRKEYKANKGKPLRASIYRADGTHEGDGTHFVTANTKATLNIVAVVNARRNGKTI